VHQNGHVQLRRKIVHAPQLRPVGRHVILELAHHQGAVFHGLGELIGRIRFALAGRALRMRGLRVELSRNGTTEPVAAGSPPIPGREEGRSSPVPLRSHCHGRSGAKKLASVDHSRRIFYILWPTNR
jgi:hypothetical protein